jgi:hypothetical protein
MSGAIPLLHLHAFMARTGTVLVTVTDLFMCDKVNAVHQLKFVTTEPCDAKVAEYAKQTPNTCRIFIAARKLVHVLF